MNVWKTWSFGALDAGLTSLYGVGGTPPTRGPATWGTRYTTVDYPTAAALALPLLAAAATTRSGLRPVLLAVSLVFGLNLFLFFGLGRGLPLPPRRVMIADATVLLAAANVVLFGWHARRFHAEATRASEEPADEASIHLQSRAGYV
jgi:hypothetical protein